MMMPFNGNLDAAPKIACISSRSNGSVAGGGTSGASSAFMGFSVSHFMRWQK
jgi:hypothetical protein